MTTRAPDDVVGVPMTVDGSGVLVAWGNSAGPFDFGTVPFEFVERAEGLKLICLGKTASGAPKHPMARGKHRISRGQQPEA